MRLVPIHCIRPGNKLARTVYDKNGRILLQQNVILTQNLLERVATNGFNSLYINDQYSEDEIEDVIKPELRQKTIQAVKESFDNFRSYYFRSKDTSVPLKQRIELKAKNKYMVTMSKITQEIVDELLTKKNLLINLVDIKSLDTYTYQHSVNVAILSLILGIELSLEHHQLYELCTGALMHDIGKAFIEQDVLFKKKPLTQEEFSHLKEHPFKGYEYLKDLRDIKAASKRIILEHHEKVDGTGYPKGLTEKQIHPFSKIVALADAYDTLTSDQPYRKALPPNEAIEFLMGSASRYFDTEMTTVFVRKIVVYPIGTIVKLSDATIGIVKETNPQLSLRPKIQKIENGKKAGIIDLATETNVVIKGVQYDVPQAQSK